MNTDFSEMELAAMVNEEIYPSTIDMNEPLQKLFDECLNFISMTDFEMD